MSFSFTILPDDISAGVPATEKEVVLDKNSSRSTTHRVLNANFGDGYEQRVLDGINTKQETFNVSFNNRPKDEINLIAAYLDKKASENFTLSVSVLSGTESVLVVCDSYNIAYIHEDYHNLTGTFRRVYEPS
jgi:phage-related protein